MKAFYVLAVAFAAIATAQGAAIDEKHPIDWYDCSNKADGNYLHPSDCTRFISCSGGVASERDCANCNVHPTRCPEGRTVYNASVDACLWADETTCSAGGGGGDSSEENGVTEETEGPVPTQGPTQGPGPDPTTEGLGTDPEGPGGLPEPGTVCDPSKCKTKGWCLWYMRCDNSTSPPTWKREDCGKDLVWNPNGDGSIHGGNCGKWDFLDPEVEAEYRSYDECLRCYWKETGECKREYLYQEPDLRERKEHSLSCDAGLVFSKAKETCLRCEDAKKGNGDPCC